MLWVRGCDVPRANASRRRIGPDQVLVVEVSVLRATNLRSLPLRRGARASISGRPASRPDIPRIVLPSLPAARLPRPGTVPRARPPTWRPGAR